MGRLIYYDRAADPIFLVALGSIAENQAKSNKTTAQPNKKLLDYCATHSDSTIRYKKIYMVIHIYSDESYLSKSQDHNISRGYFFI